MESLHCRDGETEAQRHRVSTRSGPPILKPSFSRAEVIGGLEASMREYKSPPWAPRLSRLPASLPTGRGPPHTMQCPLSSLLSPLPRTHSRAKHGTSLNPSYVTCKANSGPGRRQCLWPHPGMGAKGPWWLEVGRPGWDSACSGLLSSSLRQHHEWPSG